MNYVARLSFVVVALSVGCAGEPGQGEDSEASSTGSEASGPETSGPESSEASSATDDASTTTTTTSTTGDGDGDGDGCEWPSDSVFTQRWDFVHDQSGLDDSAGPIFVADDGSIYVAGRVNIDGLDGDAWVARLTADGDLVWAASPVGPPQTSLRDIAVDSNGRVVIAGLTLITDPAFGITLEPYVGVLADGGAEIWSDTTATHPPNPFFSLTAIDVASDDSIWVTGLSGVASSALRHYTADGTIVATLLDDGANAEDLVIAPGGEMYLMGSDGMDAVLERRDATGAVVWSVTGPGPGDADYTTGRARALALDASGAPVFAGISDYLIGNPMNPTDEWSNMWISWLDANGVELETRVYDAGASTALALAVDADGRTAFGNLQTSGAPYLRTFDATYTLLLEESLACPGGLRMAAIGSDLVFAGGVPGAGIDAYVTRIGD